MKKSILLLLAIIFCLNAYAQLLPRIDNMKPLVAQRGDAITFSGKNFPDKKNIVVSLNGKIYGKVSFVSKDSDVFIYTLPNTMELDIYNVRVQFNLSNGVTYPLTSEKITILNEFGEVKPTITSIAPVFNYYVDNAYSFDVNGSGFSLNGKDNKLIFHGMGEVPVSWEKNSKSGGIRGEVINSYKLKFTNVNKKKYSGTMGVNIGVGHLESEKTEYTSVTLSRYPEKYPLYFSIISIVILMLFLYIINKTRAKKTIDIDGKSYGLLMQVLIDPETDTLSISRFQFMVWTLVAVFSYVYLLLSRCLIQGIIEFVDIPSGLPAIILISASTTIVAAGITNVKGSKGAGSVHPSWGNLITNGGVIAPERIQLLVWTLVGAVSFILLVVIRKPESINDLPDVPQGFLQIMGVSSAGYLGGKLTRKAGPIIDGIKCVLTTDNAPSPGKSLKLTIHGHNLSDESSFKIGAEGIDLVNILGGKPQIIEKESEKPEDIHLAKVLSVTFINVKEEWQSGTFELTLTNQDGQTATWKFTVTDVESVPPDTAPASTQAAVINTSPDI